MTKDQLLAWANDPRRQDTLPFGLFEPPYQKGIVGAALVVRGVVYFRNGFSEPVRSALVKCYDRYLEAITAYEKTLAEVTAYAPGDTSPMRWFYADDEAPVAFPKTKGFPEFAKRISPTEALSCATTSADHKLAAGFYEHSALCASEREAGFGRSLDAVSFSVPRRFLQLCPGVFETLFAAFVTSLPTVHGHAGFAVNVPPMGREPNEASEYFWAGRYGPGLDVGDPMRVDVIDLIDRIKTVDWLTAINSELVQRVGGARELALPPDWFRKTPFADGGLIIQAGIEPQTGVAVGQGAPPAPPPAYVILNAALQPIVADTIDSLQDGTVNSTKPLLSTTVASEGWLRRFSVAPEKLNAYWVELHKTAKLPPARSGV